MLYATRSRSACGDRASRGCGNGHCFSFPPISRDPNDDKFLATALAAHADFLVTEDNDLLVLGDYQGVRIVDARTFLSLLADDR
ncbi:MAG: putative toxin-antitoxin system toxin component, PIN family [Thermomicrobiales bacterium]